MATDPGDITLLLAAMRKGDKEAAETLTRMLYDRLRAIARRQLGGRKGHTLTPTALVNEALMGILKNQKLEFQNRSHFFAVAAQAMRWILMDYAKAKRQKKRGDGAAIHVTLDEGRLGKSGDVDLTELHEALERLGEQDPRLRQMVELRYLVGLTVEETAETMGCSPATVKRDWALARAWLAKELAPPKAA